MTIGSAGTDAVNQPGCVVGLGLGFCCRRWLHTSMDLRRLTYIDTVEQLCASHFPCTSTVAHQMTFVLGHCTILLNGCLALHVDFISFWRGAPWQ